MHTLHTNIGSSALTSSLKKLEKLDLVKAISFIIKRVYPDLWRAKKS